LASDSIPQGNCVDLQIEGVPATIFQNAELSYSLSTIFAKVTHNRPEFAVINSADAAVGQIAGDGVLTTLSASITSMELCIDLTDLTVNPRYVIPDLAEG